MPGTRQRRGARRRTVDPDDREINGIVAQAICADGRTIYVFNTTTARNTYKQLGEAMGRRV